MLAKSVKLMVTLATILVCLTSVTASVRPTQLETIQMQGTITVVTRNSPTTYYEDRSGPTGYEYELAQSLASYLGVKLNLVVADNIGDMFAKLETGTADLAAAGISQTPESQRWLRFAAPYQNVSELVVYRRGTQKPRDLSDLPGKMLMVSADSAHAQTLRRVQMEKLPELSWSESSELDTTDLLHMVEKGEIDFTLVNTNEFNMLQAYFPNVGTGLSLVENQPMAWAFPQSRDNSLIDAVNHFFEERSTKLQLATLNERYYGHLAELDYVGAKRFLRQTVRKLDTYKPSFVEAARDYQFDWRLLAAVGYQESHWNPKATSYTGVRGMMMLTNGTASDLGVEDRLDPAQSIRGGSQYLAELRDRLGSQIDEPDRTWLALAAYNIGYGHLQDARRLAYEMGGNPNLWRDVKDSLPLLSQKRYHQHTRHGYARGFEAVDYVQNIRRYYDVLVWNEEQQLHLADPDNSLVSSITVVPPLL
ncbi:membrane-bound lytic murein transglycosylase MltF [Oceanobacter mangrovi]|uniref:membrane-bound lytic murein transglycosylase MltF n=1 Tax=Oceanobacter mangrovi TaxID=2862510 RepID=UPI001C8DBC6F|nr:membrane-bound lytic murein transglycosylase MltF [Oceanobacter mangrovi]